MRRGIKNEQRPQKGFHSSSSTNILPPPSLNQIQFNLCQMYLHCQHTSLQFTLNTQNPFHTSLPFNFIWMCPPKTNTNDLDIFSAHSICKTFQRGPISVTSCSHLFEEYTVKKASRFSRPQKGKSVTFLQCRSDSRYNLFMHPFEEKVRFPLPLFTSLWREGLISVTSCSHLFEE